MLIALNEVRPNGDKRRVLVNSNSINYMINKEDGYGSVVYFGMGIIYVVETPQQITNLVSSATPINEAYEK
jgi:hypothetical protein